MGKRRNNKEKILKDPKTILSAKMLKQIPYMDDLPSNGAKLQYITSKEFSEKFNCDYFEGLKIDLLPSASCNNADMSWIMNNWKRNSIEKMASLNSNLADDPLFKSMQQRLLNPLSLLVIANMHNDLGCGLFALNDIPIGTVLCIYAGTVRDPLKSSKQYSYSSGSTSLSIDSLSIGGLARFMQHLPNSSKTHTKYLQHTLMDPRLHAFEEGISVQSAKRNLASRQYVTKMQLQNQQYIKKAISLKRFTFDKINFPSVEIENTIVDSNVLCHKLAINNVELVVMLAKTNIKQHEIIGFSYGEQYWQSAKQSPNFFDKFGNVVIFQAENRNFLSNNERLIMKKLNKKAQSKYSEKDLKTLQEINEKLAKNNEQLKMEIKNNSEISENIIKNLLKIIPVDKVITRFSSLIEKDDLKSARLMRSCSPVGIFNDDVIIKLALKLQKSCGKSKSYLWFTEDMKGLQEQLEWLGAVKMTISNDNHMAIKYMIPKKKPYISILKKIAIDTKNLNNKASRVFLEQSKLLYPKLLDTPLFDLKKQNVDMKVGGFIKMEGNGINKLNN